MKIYVYALTHDKTDIREEELEVLDRPRTFVSYFRSNLSFTSTFRKQDEGKLIGHSEVLFFTKPNNSEAVRFIKDKYLKSMQEVERQMDGLRNLISGLEELELVS